MKTAKASAAKQSRDEVVLLAIKGSAGDAVEFVRCYADSKERMAERATWAAVLSVLIDGDCQFASVEVFKGDELDRAANRECVKYAQDNLFRYED
jgi:hypothetical protein